MKRKHTVTSEEKNAIRVLAEEMGIDMQWSRLVARVVGCYTPETRTINNYSKALGALDLHKRNIDNIYLNGSFGRGPRAVPVYEFLRALTFRIPYLRPL